MYVKKNRQMPDEDAFKLNSTLRPKAPPWHHQEGPHLCDYEKKSSLDFLDGTVIQLKDIFQISGYYYFGGCLADGICFVFSSNFSRPKSSSLFWKLYLTHCVKWGIENYSGNTVVIPRTLNRHRSSMEAHFWLHSSSVFIVFIWNHEGRAIRTQKGTHNSNRRILLSPAAGINCKK